MDNINTSEFHENFDKISKDLMDRVREDLLNGSGTCSREEIVGQIMMDNLFSHPCDPENASDWPNGPLTTEQKKFLVGVASHMGPDWCQALYHAAVFMTRVA